MTTSNNIRSHFSRRKIHIVVVCVAVCIVASLEADAALGTPQDVAAIVSGSANSDAASPVTKSKDTRAPNIDRVYGNRSLFVGQEENYRVRLKHGAYWPIHYNWELGDGTATTGNNVVQRFMAPGNYRVDVRVFNAYGDDSTSIWVSVLETPTPVVVAKETVSRSPEEAGIRASTIGSAGSSPFSESEGSAYYFSWTLETHLNRQGAEHAAKGYAEMFPDHVRVFKDVDGPGTTAYRVVVGRYATTGNALRTKSDIEEKAGRPVQLITIRS